tara:strand:- start:133 stop:336 length:204 start_codon:yes stop_codon:yes gene_type:complete
MFFMMAGSAESRSPTIPYAPSPIFFERENRALMLGVLPVSLLPERRMVMFYADKKGKNLSNNVENIG